MKKCCLIPLLCIVFGAFAQRYDNHWIMGMGTYFSPSGDSLNGNICFDFNEEQDLNIRIDTSIKADFDRFNITISNSSGDSVLFYTNGVRFWNNRNEVMQNGDSLGWGWFYTDYGPAYYYYGTPIPRSGLCFPTTDENIFNYIYIYIDTTPSIEGLVNATQLRWTQIDVEEDRLTFKDSIISESILGSSITATKDASGKGWWIMGAHWLDNCFTQLHIDSNSQVTSRNICYNLFSFPTNKYLSNHFSTDGKQFIYVTSGRINFGTPEETWFSGVQLFDFDRCTGELTLSDSFTCDILIDSMLYPYALETSSSGRFLYVFCGSLILQYDLWASDVKNSMKIVAHVTGNQVPFPSDLFQAQLAPDGKIYINSGSVNYAYSVIENPDIEGMGCNVVQDIIVPEQKYLPGFPNFPNYRLGPIDCDSDSVGIEEVVKPKMRIYPNPATTQVWVAYDGIRWERHSITFHVYDALGRTMYTKQLPQYSALHNIDVRAWSRGVYFYTIQSDGVGIGSGKFVKD